MSEIQWIVTWLLCLGWMGRCTDMQELADGIAERVDILLHQIQKEALLPQPKPTNVFLFLCILVAPHQLDLRQADRESYLTFLPQFPNTTVAYRFFTDYSDEETQAALLQEQEQYGDLHISNNLHCRHRGGHCHNSLQLVTDALSWTLEHYNFTYFLRMDSDAYLCLPQLVKTLETRPRQRYIAGYYGCKSGKSNSFFRADEAFLLFTHDVAQHYISSLPLRFTNEATTFALNFGAATLGLNIIMEDMPWRPDKPKVCDTYVFLHKLKDPADIRSSHDLAVAKLAKNGVQPTHYKPLCQHERVDAGKPEVAVVSDVWGKQYVDVRKHWLPNAT